MTEAKARAAMYVDGFNLYHAICDLNKPHLKWLNLNALAQLIMPSQTEIVAKVVFCSAYYPGDAAKKWRYDQYLNALSICGVTVVLGHYIHEEISCKSCGNVRAKPTEKASDINLALSLFNDAWNEIYDKAYLVTADSDQAATAKFFATQFPAKQLISVAPPGRNFSSNILRHSSGKIQLNASHIERCLFPPVVLDPVGKNHGRRPREYDPPAG